MAAANKPTKITIVMPFPNQVPMEPQYAETTWKLLESAIHEIYKKNASGLSFEELYRNAYNMVLHKYGDMLYGGLRRVVDQQLRTVADAVACVPDDVFLFRLNDAWHDHLQSMLMIRDILMYMVSTLLALWLFKATLHPNSLARHRRANLLCPLLLVFSITYSRFLSRTHSPRVLALPLSSLSPSLATTPTHTLSLRLGAIRLCIRH